MSSHTAASTSAASPHLTTIASIIAPLTASLASKSTIAAVIAPASALSSPNTALVHPWAASVAASSSSHAAPVWRVTGVGSHLLDLHFVSTNIAGALLNQLLRNPLLFEGYVAEVLVNGPDNLADGSKLTEVILDLVFAHPEVGELTHVNLSGLDTCLLHCDTFILQQ